MTDNYEETRIQWLLRMIEVARTNKMVMLAEPSSDDPRIKAALDRYYSEVKQTPNVEDGKDPFDDW